MFEGFCYWKKEYCKTAMSAVEANTAKKTIPLLVFISLCLLSDNSWVSRVFKFWSFIRSFDNSSFMYFIKKKINRHETTKTGDETKFTISCRFFMI